MKLVSNCPLCEEHSLHVLPQNESSLMQCLFCGYASSDKFVGSKETNKEYQNLTDAMKKWSKTDAGRIWIPGILTLPEGMVYTIDIDNMVNHKTEMKWAYSPMVDIPEDEQKNYSDGQGGFHTQKYDVDNQTVYDHFYECLQALNEQAKATREPVAKQALKMPKLKKIRPHAEIAQS